MEPFLCIKSEFWSKLWVLFSLATPFLTLTAVQPQASRARKNYAIVGLVWPFNFRTHFDARASFFWRTQQRYFV